MYTTYAIICAFNTFSNAKLQKTINAVIVLYSPKFRSILV